MAHPTIDARRGAFRALHERGCFVIPNPWDVGTARLLEQAGFQALATTSAGLAFSRGLPDAALPLEAVLDHLRELVPATALPVSADFQAGYAADAEGVARNVLRCLETGVAGLSIEDATLGGAEPLHRLDAAVARVRAARRAIDGAGGGVVLTARSEGFLVGRPDLEETIRRLSAYADAGADCLYAPGLRTRDDIAMVVAAVAPVPVNVLVGSDFITVTELADLGVRRVSVGGALARAAWGGFLEAAREIAERGTFTRLARGVPFAEIDRMFAR
jgi:2-methylisocitrate lyase-like PEP mutase family enzyme